MNFEDFQADAAALLEGELRERGHQDLQIAPASVDSLNHSYQGISIRQEGNRIGVQLDLSQAFDAYQKGEPMADIVHAIADQAEHGLNNAPDINTGELLDYGQIKDKLMVSVVSAERNSRLLETIPHERKEDLALVFRVMVDPQRCSEGTILVTNQMLDKYGVTKDQLKADALANSEVVRPAKLKGLYEMLSEASGMPQEMMGAPGPQEESIFVATVPDSVQGAGVIAYPGFLDKAAETLGRDFYILPSSIHEVLLAKDDGPYNADALRGMVRSVNAEEVDPADQLTDNVYHYDSREKIFELAEKFEARQAQREAEHTDLPERQLASKLADRTGQYSSGREQPHSLMKDLAAKKEAVKAVKPVDRASRTVTKQKGGEAL